MRASRQKGVWSHLSAGQYPWEAIVIFFPAFVHKAVLDYKQAFHQLLSVYSLGGELRCRTPWCRRFGGLTAVERGCLVERRDLATRQTVGVGDERWIGSGQGIHSRTRVAITKGRGGKSMARKLQSYKLSCSFIALARTAINQPLSPSFLRAFNIKIQGKSSTSEDLHTTMRDAGSAAMAYISLACTCIGRGSLQSPNCQSSKP